MQRWNIVEIPVDRNPRDNREESWKIQGSKSEWQHVASKIRKNGEVPSSDRRDLLEQLHRMFGAGCVEDFNERQVSLGMIKPTVIGYRLEKREDYEPSAQMQLGRNVPFLTIKNYPLRPVIEYRCPDCKAKAPHSQQVVEWGVFEWMRQNPKEPEKVWENLHLSDSGYTRSFLVGNMALHRNSFMVIGFFRFKTKT
jgi:hypothetical protein